MKTDLEIQKDVMDELRWAPFLNASEIGVAVKNGIVTLSGTVDTYSKKSTAEQAAKKIAGVKAVAEDIEVKLAATGKRNDTELAEAVIHALKWNTSVPDDKIKVKVEDGWVTLEGQVEWEFQRKSARDAIEYLSGVEGITNNIKIVTSVKVPDIKNKISSAFHRSATVDADKITVSVNGSKVTLSGKVRSFVEKNDAENAAWSAPGITNVENKIDIDTEVFAY